MIEYRGYTAVLEVDDQAGNIFGSTIGMADVVTFHGKTVDEAKACFRESVDAYIRHCAETGKEPGKPFSGKFQVRLPADSHRALALAAESRGVSLNEAVKIAVGRFLEAEGDREPHTETVKLEEAPAHLALDVAGLDKALAAQEVAERAAKPKVRQRRIVGPLAR